MKNLTVKTKPAMGVSQWKEYGKKYGYWEFFENEVTSGNPTFIMRHTKNEVRLALATQKAELVKKIEGLKKYDPTYRDDTENEIYNEALDAVIELLKGVNDK